ncbi:fumarylacetoacetate hydrolase family protein [Stomatohabitans albus]|uniref:fumarylacetoacetate hydrolase family protein n=1 Tax=Stomatohabitans albus TaxID=3110766 RepID=UPI00300CD977
MRFARVARPQSTPAYVSMHHDGQHVLMLDGHPLNEALPNGQAAPLDQVQLLSPVTPTKVLAVAKNYVDHAKEFDGTIPDQPIVFDKLSTSVIGPDAAIMVPEWAGQVDYEGELAVVIGAIAKDVRPEHAHAVIWGYTIGNDVTARALQRTDGQWTRAKGMDTFCPLGPWIDTSFEPRDHRLTTIVNGEIRQQAALADMIFDVPTLISYISRFATLLPGDVIMTGTPGGVGSLRDGDSITISIDALGELTNTVKLVTA